MKKRNVQNRMLLFMIVVLLLQLLPANCVFAQNAKTIELVFTHDIHSYLDEYEVEEDGKTMKVGGMSRLAYLLNEKRAADSNLLVLDAGDFSMGTLFHTLFSSEALEYSMLGQLGFDATTFGNHEFDFGSEGLASMFESAAQKSDQLAPVVICNVDWTVQDEATRKIKAAAEKCGLAEYIILQKGDVKVAVTGVFGKDALECAPTCELTIKDPVKSVKETVAKIKKEEAPDLIVCISHSGTWENAGQSEDEQLAAAVPDLDVIVSGHTHTTLEAPIVSGNTYIGSCGAYGRNTGSMALTQQADGRWALDNYELVSMDESVGKDTKVSDTLDEFRESIDKNYLAQFGYTAEQVLAENEIVFEPIMDLEMVHTEHKLGNLMSDAYRYAAETYGSDQDKVDVAIVPAGTVRGTYLPGEVTVTNVFDSFSLGSGADGVAGYPLIKIYLTGEELRTAAEVDASVSDMMMTARLYMSGLSFTYNPNRMILDKVTEISLNPELMEDSKEELDKDKLYCVVADLYSGQMLGAVSDKSFGILKLVPKDADGNPIEDFEDAIVYDKEGKEIKAWTAIASYFESFGQNKTGTGEVPAYYQELHERKLVDEDDSLSAKWGHPGKYGKMIYGVLAGVLVFVFLVILLIVKLVKRIKRKRKQKKQSA